MATCTTTSPTNENVENLFDYNKETEWTAYIDPSIQVVYTFNNQRREWFNSYSLTSASSLPERDPLSWRLEGSEDGLQWDRLDYQSNFIFSKRGQTVSFNLASNRISYNSIRLSITAVRGSTETVAQLAELRLFATQDEVLPTGLYYPTEQVTYTVGITEDFSIKPLSSGFQSYSISPDLPSGINIDVDSGEISGTTTFYNDVLNIYTVTAMSSVEGTSSTATVMITFTSCSGPTKTRIDLLKYNQLGSDRESWTLSCASSNVTLSSTGLDSTETQVYHVCVNREICTLSLQDSLGDAWVKGSYLEITMYNGDKAYNLGKALVADSDTTVVKLNTDFLVNESSDVKVYTGTEYRDNWYSDTSFTSSASWALVSTNVPLERRHWYIYMNSATPIVKSNYMSYSVHFYCRAGAVLYVNGVERYRINVPTGAMTASTDITGGSSTPYWHTYTGLISELGDATNAFAFEITNAVNVANITVDFKMSVYLDSSSDVLSLTEDADAQASTTSGSYPVSRMIDGDWSSYTLLPRSSRSDPQWVGVKFQQDGRRVINRYCITCNPDVSRYDPTDWMFVGSNDISEDASWTTVDTRENVRFSKRSQRLCFTTSTTGAFGWYRLVMTANRNIFPTNAFAISELELFTVANAEEVPFAYQETSVQGYVNQPFPTLTTTASIGVVTVSPDLPSGLSLDQYTGRISGRPTASNTGGTRSFTFTNTRGSSQTTAVVEIKIDECTLSNRVFFLHMPTTGAMGPKLSFTVKLADGQQLLGVTSMPLQEEMYWPVCTAPTQVQVQLSSLSSTWGQFYLEVMTEDQVVIGKSVMKALSYDTYYPFYAVTPTDSWKYLYGNPNNVDWMQPTFSDAAWSEATPGNFPSLTNVAQYYRRTFSITGVNDTTTIEYRIRVNAGSIVYLNGIEIYRVNMPTGTPNSETLASSEFLTTQILSGTVVISTNSLVEGNNVLAVENHKLSGTRTQNDFKTTLFIANYKTYTMIEGEPSADIMTSGFHDYLKAFDFIDETSYVSGPRCEGAILQWTYPMGSRYTVNSYTFTSRYGACLANFPTSWAVEGSNDGVNWSMVDYVSEYSVSVGGADATRSFYPTTAYNTFRLRVTGCKNTNMGDDCSEGLTANEFSLFNDQVNFDNVCQGDLSFGPALVGGYSFGVCPTGYTGYRRRLCESTLTFGAVENFCTPEAPSYLAYLQTSYELTTGMEITTPIVPSYICVACTFTSSPSLPSNLVLDSSTGSITGAGRNSTQAFFYTITGRNTAGSISTTLRISIVDSGANCPADFDNGWSATPAGTNATRSCPDSIHYIGSMTRLCQNVVPPAWGEIYDACELLTPNITYPVTNVTLEKRVEMNVITPEVFGAELDPITISPSLPSGLYFDSATGSINGAPSVKDVVGTVYTITVSNRAGNFSTTLNITIIALTCPAQTPWAETDAGDRAYQNCGAQMEGSHYRDCVAASPPYWDNPVNTCVYSAPVISYPTPAVSLYRNVPMTTMTPTIVNYASSWSVSPTLPTGLSFSSTNGVISGTPTVESAQASYTVTASNQDSSGTTVITITVALLKCPTDGVWVEVEHGTTSEVACSDPTNMEGRRQRTCILSGTTASWGTEDNTCKYRQPVISYRSGIVGYKGEQISALEPTHQYRITSYSIQPTLPAGLSFDSASGIISGIPTEGLDSTVFTVTAVNEDNSATTTITIQVIVPMCATDGEWESTERGNTAYLFCSGTSGVRTRTCGESKTDRNPKWNPEDTSMCLATPEKTKPSEGKAFIRVTINVGM